MSPSMDRHKRRRAILEELLNDAPSPSSGLRIPLTVQEDIEDYARLHEVTIEEAALQLLVTGLVKADKLDTSRVTIPRELAEDIAAHLDYGTGTPVHLGDRLGEFLGGGL